MMRLARSILALTLLAFATSAYPANLHVIILDFGSKEVNPASLSKNLKPISLRKLISSSTKLPTSLQNASIIFAQSIPAQRNSSLSSSTISGNSFSQLNAQLDASSIRLNIRLSLTPEFNMGSPSQFSFSAAGPLPSGDPVLLSIQEKSILSKTTVRGIPSIKESKKTRAIIAQFEP